MMDDFEHFCGVCCTPASNHPQGCDGHRHALPLCCDGCLCGATTELCTG